MTSTKLAFLWQRFGPYHHARLRGATAFFGSVIGIEVASADQYAWIGHKPDELTYHYQTLFVARKYEKLSRREVKTAIFRVLDNLGPDCVAINGWAVPEARAAAKWCQKNSCKAILMSETFVGSGSWLKEKVKQRRVRDFDGALVGGKWHRDYLAGLGFPRERIHLGYDAIDTEYFSKGATEALSHSQALRKQHKLPEKYFFANTRFLPRKKIDVLLQAYAKYRSKMKTPFHLVISGSGECEQEWKRLAVRFGVAAYVSWPGFVQYQELPAYYGLAHAFVHIASREAWGLVVNEAAACGLPIIVGQNVGARCELVDATNGYCVDPFNIDSIVEALCAVHQLDSRNYDEMSRASVAKVSRFGIERFGSGMLAAVNS